MHTPCQFASVTRRTATRVKSVPNLGQRTLNSARSLALLLLYCNIHCRHPTRTPQRRHNHQHGLPLLLILADCWSSNSATTDLLQNLRRACALLGDRTTFGFSSQDIGTRSLRSGAAMALFLAGHPPANIMLLGRWRSTAFLQYIRPQILEWTSSLSPTMLHTDDYRDADSTPTQIHPAPSHHFHAATFASLPYYPSMASPPFEQAKRDLMVCPEKDTTPEKERKTGTRQGP